MANCEPLLWYGIAVTLLSGWLVLIPYWRGRAELFSAWNFLLVGIGVFIGVGCIEAATSPMRFPGMEWFEPTQDEVKTWMMSTTVFLVVLFAARRYDPVSRSLAARSFNKWPPISTSVILAVTLLCAALAISARLPFRIVFVTGVLINVSHKAMIFACLFSFLLWYRNRSNLLWAGVFVLVFLAMCFLAVLASGGRRMLLSVLLGPILIVYFYQVRFWRPSKSILVLGAAVAGIFVVSLMYSTIRHFDRRGEMQGQGRDRSAGRALDAIKNISTTAWYERFAGDVLWYFSQHVVHYGLLTDRFVADGRLEPKPMNTFRFMLVYPVPRAIYPNKPEALGRTITNSVGRRTSWGTGVAGHAAYEGGLLVAAMFGYFAAFGVRFFDDPLARQPTNPFLIGMLAAAGVQIVAWPRGDIAVMTFETAECLLFVLALGVACRFVFGTDGRRLAGAPRAASGRAIQHVPAR